MYRIIYGSGTGAHEKNSGGRRILLTGLLFLFFCMAVYKFWPEGRMLLQTLLLPGTPETTLQAAEVFAAEMGSGYALQDAVRTFCAAVLGNGYSN